MKKNSLKTIIAAAGLLISSGNTGCSYNSGDYRYERGSIKEISGNRDIALNNFGRIADSNRDKLITRKEARRANSLLNRGLGIVSNVIGGFRDVTEYTGRKAGQIASYLERAYSHPPQ